MLTTPNCVQSCTVLHASLCKAQDCDTPLCDCSLKPSASWYALWSRSSVDRRMSRSCRSWSTSVWRHGGHRHHGNHTCTFTVGMASPPVWPQSDACGPTVRPTGMLQQLHL